MKWIVLGGKEQEMRFQALSEYLKTVGCQNELEFLNPEPNDLYLELENLVKKVDQIRMQSPYNGLALHFQNRTTDFVSMVGGADAIIKESDGSWWPQNLMYEAFQVEFVKHVKELDLNSYALIVGSGAASRVAIAALIKIGFSRFQISDRFEERARKTIELLKRRFFKIEFSFISAASLMLLPGSSSVLVNGTPLILENDVLKDLYYFNFLKLPATIIDLNIIPPSTPLMEEGMRIGTQALGGYEIAAHADVIWAKKALNLNIDLAVYKEFLKGKLSAVPFDPKPYRFE